MSETLSLNMCLNTAPCTYIMRVEVQLFILFSFLLDCGKRITSRCGRHIPEGTAAENNSYLAEWSVGSASRLSGCFSDP
jgi:hypothetical protein